MAQKEISVNTQWEFEAPDVRDNFIGLLPLTGTGDPNGVLQGDYLGQLYISDTAVPYICIALQDGETDSAWGLITLTGA
jgi:hypothetical protein